MRKYGCNNENSTRRQYISKISASMDSFDWEAVVDAKPFHPTRSLINSFNETVYIVQNSNKIHQI